MLPLIFATVVLNGSAQIFLRLSLQSSEFSTLLAERNISGLLKIAMEPWTIAGLSSYIVSVVLWMLVLSKVPASLAYPFISLAFLFVLGAGVLFLNEHFSVGKLTGSILIVIGVSFISRS